MNVLGRDMYLDSRRKVGHPDNAIVEMVGGSRVTPDSMPASHAEMHVTAA